MAIGTTAAIIGSAAIGAGSSILAGNKAANAQKKASQQAAETERYFFDTARADQAPYREVGYGALGKLAQMYGVETKPTTDWEDYVRGNPDAMANWQAIQGTPNNTFGDMAAFGEYHYGKDGSRRDLAPFQTGGSSGGVADYGGFEASPGYQFRMDEGQKAIERSQASRGLFNSGASVKALTRFAQGTASEEFEKYANALRSMAGIGQTATNATQQAGANAAGGISRAYTDAGNARASSYANVGASVNNGISNVMGAYLMNQGNAAPKLPYDMRGF